MPFLLLLAAVALGLVAVNLYPADTSTDLSPSARAVSLSTSSSPDSTSSSGHGDLFDISFAHIGGSTITRVGDVAGFSLDAASVFNGQLGQGGSRSHSNDPTFIVRSPGGFVADSSKEGRRAAVLVPPIVVTSDDWDGTGPNPAAGIEVQEYVDFTDWQNFSWSGGTPPVARADILTGDKVNAMEWTEYTDENGSIPGIELVGTDEQLQQQASNDLFLSGLAGGVAGAAILGSATELGRWVRERRGRVNTTVHHPRGAGSR